MKVLLVDDDSLVLRGIGRYLRSQGFEVTTAAGAEEALRILEWAKTDCVVSDVDMPGMDGFGLKKEVTSRFPGIRIILHSGAVYEGVLEKGKFEKLVEEIKNPPSPH